MPIDDRLRTGLPAAFAEVRPDVDAELTTLRIRAGRRTRVRRTTYAVGLLVAAAVAAVTFSLGDDGSLGSVDPVAPGGEVHVLDSGRGSPEKPVPLDPGRYAIPFFGAPDDAPWGEVEVPTGWGQDRLHLATGPDLDPHLRRIELVTADSVAADPCEGDLQPVPAKVTAIVTALSEQRTVQPSEARSVSIDGHSGQLMRFQVPSQLDVEKCWDGKSLKPLGFGSSYTSAFPGWTYRLWVLDAAGDPLVIMAAHGPRTTPDEHAELTAMVEGITFVEPR